MTRLAIGALILVVAALVLLKLVAVPTSVPAKAGAGPASAARVSLDTFAMERDAPARLPVEQHPLH